MKKEYKAPESRVIILKTTPRLLIVSGDIVVTSSGFEGSYSKDDIIYEEEGN